MKKSDGFDFDSKHNSRLHSLTSKLSISKSKDSHHKRSITPASTGNLLPHQNQNKLTTSSKDPQHGNLNQNHPPKPHGRNASISTPTQIQIQNSSKPPALPQPHRKSGKSLSVGEDKILGQSQHHNQEQVKRNSQPQPHPHQNQNQPKLFPPSKVSASVVASHSESKNSQGNAILKKSRTSTDTRKSRARGSILKPRLTDAEMNEVINLGFKCLIEVGSFYIEWQPKPTEVVPASERQVIPSRIYNVLNESGKTIFNACEYTSRLNRFFCGTDRSFVIKILDPNNNNTEVIYFERKCNCTLCFFSADTAGSKVVVKSSLTEEVIGEINQICSGITPEYEITVPHKLGTLREQTVLVTIKGPNCATLCPYPMLYCNVGKFNVYFTTCDSKNLNHSNEPISFVGEIMKDSKILAHRKEMKRKVEKKMELENEAIQNGKVNEKNKNKNSKNVNVNVIPNLNEKENPQKHKHEESKIESKKHEPEQVFGLQLQTDLNPRLKALLLAAIFIIDFSYYERVTKRNIPGWAFFVLFLIIVIIILAIVSKHAHLF